MVVGRSHAEGLSEGIEIRGELVHNNSAVVFLVVRLPDLAGGDALSGGLVVEGGVLVGAEADRELILADSLLVVPVVHVQVGRLVVAGAGPKGQPLLAAVLLALGGLALPHHEAISVLQLVVVDVPGPVLEDFLCVNVEGKIEVRFALVVCRILVVVLVGPEEGAIGGVEGDVQLQQVLLADDPVGGNVGGVEQEGALHHEAGELTAPEELVFLGVGAAMILGSSRAPRPAEEEKRGRPNRFRDRYHGWSRGVMGFVCCLNERRVSSAAQTR
mmetsp:Transcript_10820/g.24676  ORF Transcript_10820/g.24676 Transcript_10820/m.24676 type:complete len:272 (-) Transcript_10820:306-1121(-)